VYHAACIGRWDVLKALEAERQALESTGSVRAEQEALKREIADGQARGAQLVADLADCQSRLAAAQVAQARVREAQASEEEEDSALLASELGILPNGNEEMEELLRLEELLQLFSQRVQQAKGELQHLKLEDRKTQGRLAQQRCRLKVLEDELAADAAKRSAAGLPCPVCRAPIERALLPSPLVAQSPHDSEAAASVNELPDSLRKHVREEQRRQQAILAARRTDSDPAMEVHLAALAIAASAPGARAEQRASDSPATVVTAAAVTETAAADGSCPGNRWRGRREQVAGRTGGTLGGSARGRGRNSADTEAHTWSAAANTGGRDAGDGRWSEDHSSSQGGNWSWNSWSDAWGKGSWNNQSWDANRRY